MSALEPLDPELAALFAREPIGTPPAGAKERVRERVVTSAAIAIAIDAGFEPTTAPLGRRAIGLALATFALGAAVGAGAVVATVRSEPRVVYVDFPTPVTSATSITPPEEHTAMPYSLPPARETPREAPPIASARDTLKKERAIIEDARSKLAAGDAESALRRLEDHTRQFPKAHLAEEREALAIQALVNVERYDDARTRAATFRERWPSSVYLPAVDATLGSIP